MNNFEIFVANVNAHFEKFVENVNAMLEKSGMTKTGLAKALGMSHSHLVNILNGRTAPNLGDLVAIADFFAVPLDFLTGRCSREEADKILKDYGKVYMDLRRTSFEAYLGGRKGLVVEEGVEEPWPYNLYHNVFREPCAHVITKEQIANIFKAIGLLPYRERRVVLAYHQDGKDLKTLAKELAITPERVRLFLNKGIKTLRTEGLKELMQGGPEWTFVTEWEGGITVSTPCRVDFDRRIVYDVAKVDVDGLGTLVDQYIIFDGRRFTAGDGEEAEFKLVW